MGDEPNEDSYRPKGPAPECDTRSTPRWQFALWGIWGVALGVLRFVRAVLWWIASALFGAPVWLLFEHVPDLLADIGRVHNGVEPVRPKIPTTIWSMTFPGVTTSADWVRISAFAWAIFSYLSALTYAAIKDH